MFRRSDVLCSAAFLYSELEFVGEVSRLLTGSAICGKQSGGQQTLHHRHWSAFSTCGVSQGGYLMIFFYITRVSSSCFSYIPQPTNMQIRSAACSIGINASLRMSGEGGLLPGVSFSVALN